MTKVMLAAPIFDVEVTESLNYKRVPNYVVRYGLQAKVFHTFAAACHEFNNCLGHARACEGEDID